MNLTGEKLLRIEYIPLDRVARWDRNPKRHDLPRLMASIRRYGFRDAVIYDGTLAALVAGHGRAAALEAMRNAGEIAPYGVALDSSGAWYLPVQFGNDAESRAVAEAFALDHNNLTLSGSGLDASALWEPAGYADVLRGLAEGFALPETVTAWTAGQLLGLNSSGANDPDAEWRGMPEFENDDAFGAVLTLKVHFASEEDVAKFAQIIGQNVTVDTQYIWYPKQKREELLKFRAVDES